MTEVDERTDQEARSTLLDYYGAELRHWGTILLSLAVAAFTIVQTGKAFEELGALALSFIAASAIIVLCKIAWYGTLCSFVFRAEPVNDPDRRYLYQINEGLVNLAKTSKIRRVIWILTRMKVYLVVIPSLALCLRWNWPYILIPVVLVMELFGQIGYLSWLLPSIVIAVCLLYHLRRWLWCW